MGDEVEITLVDIGSSVINDGASRATRSSNIRLMLYYRDPFVRPKYFIFIFFRDEVLLVLYYMIKYLDKFVEGVKMQLNTDYCLPKNPFMLTFLCLSPGTACIRSSAKRELRSS
jgi:hypothetical protein